MAKFTNNLRNHLRYYAHFYVIIPLLVCLLVPYLINIKVAPKKNEEITEDDEKRMLEEVQQLINDYNKKVDEKYKEKEEELMKV